MDFNLYNLNSLKNFVSLKNHCRKFIRAPRARFKPSAQKALNWLIPRICISCQQQQAQVDHPCCLECYASLPFQSHCCEQCGQSYSAGADYCGRCITQRPPFDACFCAFKYESPIDQQIKALKYQARPELAKSLAELLYVEIQANGLELPDVLVPVPMHTSKLRQRGYNQSLLLSKQLSKLTKIPYDRQLLRKHKATPAQAELSLKQRQTNLTGCFEFIGKAPIHAAIVDDVYTTGATAAEIAKVLKRNGVDYIQFWGIAHTI